MRSMGCFEFRSWPLLLCGWGLFILRTLNEKKTPGAPDWEQIFVGGFTSLKRAALLAHKAPAKRGLGRNAPQPAFPGNKR